MATEAEDCIERLNYLREEVKKEIHGMTAEGLNWKPLAPNTNSIFALTTHIVGTESAWIHHFVGNRTIARDRDSEFTSQGRDVTILEDMLNKARDITVQVIGHLSSYDLSTEKPSGENGNAVSYRWAILHTIEHLGQHLGHLTLTKQMYEFTKQNTL